MILLQPNRIIEAIHAAGPTHQLYLMSVHHTDRWSAMV